jgi:hypothetical protein
LETTLERLKLLAGRHAFVWDIYGDEVAYDFSAGYQTVLTEACAILARQITPLSVELLQIARHALLDLSHAPVHLGPREVLVAIVDRLELAAVDRDVRLREQA